MQDYRVESLTKDKSVLFKGVYSDFIAKAVSEYKFELEPLPFDEFVDAVAEGLIQCLVLYENDFPTAFLVYTTAISESIELNMIHCLGNEDLITKRKLLLEEFLERTESNRKKAVVCYPMMGSQGDFTGDIAHFGFRFIGLAVLRFLMNDEQSNLIFDKAELSHVGYQMRIAPWNDSYKKEAIKVIHHNFKETSDALFDTRFKSMQGTEDIINKITDSIYGEFLPQATSVLLHLEKPVGFAFTNVTGGRIANIPLVAINKEYRGKGYSEHLLKRSVGIIKEWVTTGERGFSEINVTTETDNYGALKMYRNVGFKEDYSYTQAYLPISK
ncbi:MAG: GNAT family N-acetyltransferase [Cyanobacteria bacterium RUI128]|nr:GNAT family N-acetyltransferase [Cyanobacteria bacterium RUI128]